MPYTPIQAARAAGISVSSLKNYVARYPGVFSPTARPGTGRRIFTEQDVKALCYIAEARRDQMTPDEIAGQIATGALDKYNWQPSQHGQQAEPPSEAEAEPPAVLVLVNALRGQLDNTRADLEQARSREQELMERIAQAERAIGQLEGELNAYKGKAETPPSAPAPEAARPSWWRRLLGRD